MWPYLCERFDVSKRTRQQGQLAFDLFVKTCPHCLRELAGWEFAKNKARKDGLQVYCRRCWNAKQSKYYLSGEGYREKSQQRSKLSYKKSADRYRIERKAYREANKEAISERGKRWYAANRDKVSDRKKAWRQANPEVGRERSQAYWLANIDKVKAQHQKWKLANRDLIREQNRAWVEANRDKHNAKSSRRRALMAQVQTIDFTAEQLAQRWAYYGNQCWICHCRATATDHVKPIAKGGSHMLCNLRPICKSCNSAKGAKWPFVLDVVTCVRA